MSVPQQQVGLRVTIKGHFGRLLRGSRAATEFAGWTATLDQDAYVVRVGKHEPDPVLWDRLGDACNVELDIGKQTWTGQGTIESRSPLVIRAKFTEE